MAKKSRYVQTVRFHTDRKIMIKSLGIIITELWTLGSIFDSIFMEIYVLESQRELNWRLNVSIVVP